MGFPARRRGGGGLGESSPMAKGVGKRAECDGLCGSCLDLSGHGHHVRKGSTGIWHAGNATATAVVPRGNLDSRWEIDWQLGK